MQEGYIADQKIPSRWISGTPRRSLLQILGLRRKEQRQIQSHRCKACGFLELYAETVVG